jgi:uncharacterized membrane protein
MRLNQQLNSTRKESLWLIQHQKGAHAVKKSVRALVTASAMSVPALLALAMPSSAHADFTVCNETSRKVQVAVAFIDRGENEMVSKGWYFVNPNGCDLLVATSQTTDPTGYYFYAHDVDGSNVWQGDAEFCTTSAKFTIVAPDDRYACQHNGGEYQSFTFVEAPSGNFRQRLSDGTPKID